MVMKVVQLRVGRARELATGDWDCDCSVTLVTIATKHVLVDTGGAWAAPELQASLAARGLAPEDISLVVCSHGHSDHVGCLALFPHATHIVGRDINRRHEYVAAGVLARDQSIGRCTATVSADGAITTLVLDPSDAPLQVVTTPGHTGSCVSVLLASESPFNFERADGANSTVHRVAIVGDLWECDGDEGWWRDLSEMPALHEKSRAFVLAWQPEMLVPGHGAAFAPTAQD
ncbi:metallo-beta-lactamase domain-containing protein 1-like [Achlya hypogyna]|uniref:Metallo-beta-lactamase domain-containing protein 1 n=1 Tax=Achlya hypogyna TaxID=1202772 RepID=A0A1V9YYL0_ACHHY|nr:metallo-beta-lactamase domain-containing protein 1-like [Achlya hypogyna]